MNGRKLFWNLLGHVDGRSSAAGHWDLTQSDCPACDFCVFFASTQEKEETHDSDSKWVTRPVTWALFELQHKRVISHFSDSSSCIQTGHVWKSTL